MENLHFVYFSINRVSEYGELFIKISINIADGNKLFTISENRRVICDLMVAVCKNTCQSNKVCTHFWVHREQHMDNSCSLKCLNGKLYWLLEHVQQTFNAHFRPISV